MIMAHFLQRIVLVAGLCLLTLGTTMAQPSSFRTREPFEPQYIVGLQFVPEWQGNYESMIGGRNYGGFSAGTGLSFEARITRHSGVETGFYYKYTTADAGPLLDGSGLWFPERHRRYFSIPLLYKYYSRIVNVGAGMTYDVVFRQSVGDKTKDRLGLVVKVTKDITLYKNLFLEPEVHFAHLWELEREPQSFFWVGFQLGLKYRF